MSYLIYFPTHEKKKWTKRVCIEEYTEVLETQNNQEGENALLVFPFLCLEFNFEYLMFSSKKLRSFKESYELRKNKIENGEER